MTKFADLDDITRARLAAKVVTELGWPAVYEHLDGDHGAPVDGVPDGVRITPPRPGRSVLACRCGRVMHAGEMRRQSPRPGRFGNAPRIDPIVCRECA